MKYITNILKNLMFYRGIFIVFFIKCKFEKEDNQIIENNKISHDFIKIFHFLSKYIDCFHNKMQF